MLPRKNTRVRKLTWTADTRRHSDCAFWLFFFSFGERTKTHTSFFDLYCVSRHERLSHSDTRRQSDQNTSHVPPPYRVFFQSPPAKAVISTTVYTNTIQIKKRRKYI